MRTHLEFVAGNECFPPPSAPPAGTDPRCWVVLFDQLVIFRDFFCFFNAVPLEKKKKVRPGPLDRRAGMTLSMGTVPSLRVLYHHRPATTVLEAAVCVCVCVCHGLQSLLRDN